MGTLWSRAAGCTAGQKREAEEREKKPQARASTLRGRTEGGSENAPRMAAPSRNQQSGRS